MKVKYVAHAVRWFDKVNGNTYHSVRITRTEDGATIAAPFQYGYGDGYRQSAIYAMYEAGWLPEKYKPGKATENTIGNLYLYERENEYPIHWNVSEGLKRDCIANGEVTP